MDEYGEEKYIVEGEIFSWGKKLHVYDVYEREVAFIKQELFTFMPCYHVYVGDRDIAEVRKELGENANYITRSRVYELIRAKQGEYKMCVKQIAYILNHTRVT